MKMDIGGAETHIAELCRALVSRGHTVFVASAGGRLVDELRAAGAEHISAPLDKKDPVSVIKSYVVLRRAIKSNDFDIVHAHARIPAFICEKICARFDVRFVTTAHYTFSVSPIWRSLSRWGEHTFAVSEDIERYLRRNYLIESANITFVPNGIDEKKFAPDASAGEDIRKAVGAVGKKTVVHISRLDKESSVCARVLLDAAEKLSAEDFDGIFILVGGGNTFDEISSRAAEINSRAGRRVVLCVGPKTDVVPYLSAADVFVGPSRAALEAMAAKVPVIVSGPQGHMGVLSVDNAEYAYKTNLCARGSDIATAEKLADEIKATLLMTDDERAALLSLQSEFLSRYTVDKMTDIYENEYLRLYKIKTKAAPRAVICGYYGYRNAGDRAMLLALTRGLREIVPDMPLCVMSNKPKSTRAEYVVSSVHRYNVFAVRRAIKKAGTLIFGGGNLLQDATSRRSLSYYLYILKTARRLGAHTLIYANGLGPLSTEAIRRVTPYLADADYVSMRDNGSFEFCRRNGINAILAADPAFMLKGKESADTRGGYFIVAPRETGDEEFEYLCRAVTDIQNEYGYRPVVAAMYSAEDEKFCKKLAQKTGALLLEDGITDYGILSTAAAGAELVISARLHALICACAAACPMISVGSEKNASFMRDIGLGHSAVKSYKDVFEITDTVLKNSGAIRQSLAASAEKMRAMAKFDVSAVAEKIKGGTDI